MLSVVAVSRRAVDRRGRAFSSRPFGPAAVPPAFDGREKPFRMCGQPTCSRTHGVSRYSRHPLSGHPQRRNLLEGHIARTLQRAPSAGQSALYRAPHSVRWPESADGRMAFSHPRWPLPKSSWNASGTRQRTMRRTCWAHEAGAALQAFGHRHLLSSTTSPDTSEADVRAWLHRRGKYRRLLALKGQYDPGNLFSLNLKHQAPPDHQFDLTRGPV